LIVGMILYFSNTKVILVWRIPPFLQDWYEYELKYHMVRYK
jgi:hypothetical protein